MDKSTFFQKKKKLKPGGKLSYSVLDFLLSEVRQSIMSL